MIMRHPNAVYAVCVMGQMTEFVPGDQASEAIACNAMVEAGIMSRPIYYRGAEPGEWIELDGAKLLAIGPVRTVGCFVWRERHATSAT
jgi:hypothetical protein